jgi:uncharacterized FlaG/YvyC family protein
MVLNIEQSPTLLPTARTGTAPQEEKGAVSLNIVAAPAKENKPAAVDTISISSQSRQAITDLENKKVKSEIAAAVAKGKQSDQAAAKVEFVYDLNGEVITKYLDSSNRLVYQTPSELMLRLKESTQKTDSSVDTKA